MDVVKLHEQESRKVAAPTLAAMGSESNFGANNYEEKMQMMDKANDGRITMDNVVELGNVFKKLVTDDGPKKAIETLKAVKSAVTPGFIKRMNNKKIHIKYVEEAEQKLEAIRDDTNVAMTKELEYNAKQKATDKLIKELLKARELVREEVREVLHNAKLSQVEDEYREFHKRRAAQLAELEENMARQRREQVEREEKEAEDNRIWRIQFYSEQAKAYKAEAEATSPSKVRRRRYENQLDRIKDDYDDREQARIRMQIEAPKRSAKVGLDEDLGIYSVEHKAREDEDIEMEDMENLYDVYPLDAQPNSGFEFMDTERNDTKSALLREEQLYEALQGDISEMKDAISRMLDMKEILEREQRQINSEMTSIEKDQLGPPRRHPTGTEIPSMHMWKTRSTQTMHKLRDLDYTIEMNEKRKKDMVTQSNQIAKNIAVLKEQKDKIDSDMNKVNSGLGNLPMVVGRSLDKVPGLGLSANPKEMFDAITQKSKLVTLKAESEVALKYHKESNKMDQSIWFEKLQESGTRSELESMISRITEISDRLQRSKVDSMRLNIVDSLKAFLASTMRLHEVRQKIVGILPWYLHHDYQLSSDVVKYVTSNVMGAITFEADNAEDLEKFANGVTLGESKSGYCTGTIALPKDCLWSISITITRQGKGEEYDHPDGSDFVTLKLGPSVTSLSTVGTFFNQINPTTGTVLYDVKQIFRGNTFAFRFDFSSSTTDVKRHLAICTGIYEEYAMPPLEEVADPQDFSKMRVLSSYVKMLRIEETAGKMRETRLLEELIAVEESKADYWDSLILTQYLQRFGREYFLRILKAEILIQQEAQKANYIKEAAEASQQRALMADADLAKESRIEQSKKKYMMKKRAFQRKFVDDGRDLVTKRLILWDDIEKKWRNVTVVECLVDWIENGLIAKVRHIIQEYDDGHEAIGKPFEIDLTKYKYFESPIQTLDKSAILKMREKKGWMEAIDKIRYEVKKTLQTLAKAMDKYEKKALKDCEMAKGKMSMAFDYSIEGKAKDVADLPAAKKKIKGMIPAVLLDMRKGVVIIDAKKKRKEQAKEVARERFIQSWIQDRKQELKAQFAEMDQEVQDDLLEKKKMYQRECRRVQNSADQRINQYKDKIRNQYLQLRQQLLKQIQFPKEVFQRVVPKSYHCEHLRTKAWGDLYSKGVKCMQCGIELSNLHDEEHQLRGIGSGANYELWTNVIRHRDNEQSYRFKTNEELALVESERIRLEKERRVIDMNECYFYDYQDLRVIYEFDHRHRQSLKSHGIFRQGLQWNEDEISTFEERRVIAQTRLLDQKGLPETLLEDYDPLGDIENPPPTFRAVDERHKSQYHDLLYHIGRLHNFQKKIFQFKMQRFDLLHDRDVYSVILDSLHRESYVLETQLQDLEADLDRSSKLISTFASMQRLWQQASIITQQAKRDLQKAEMARVGVWDVVKEVGDTSTLVHDEMKSLLKVKFTTEAKLDNVERLLSFKQKQHEIFKQEYAEKHYLYKALKYVMPGNFVMTKMFGPCYVIAYREKDDMVLVNLPFGKPLAKAFMYYRDIVDYESSLQYAECTQMGLEDDQMQSWVRHERTCEKKELAQMRREEDSNREYYSFVDLNKNQSQQFKDAIDHAVHESFLVTESRIFNKMQAPDVKKVLTKMIADRKKRRKDYIGPSSSRPKNMSFFEIRQQRKLIALELKQQFVTKQALEAEEQVNRDILDVRSNYIQRYAFDQMIDGVVKEMIFQLCYEAHSEGKDAKHYAEKKSGIYISHPAYMQYDTYNQLAALWQRRKDALKKSIEVNRGEVNKILAANQALVQQTQSKAGNNASNVTALIKNTPSVDEFGDSYKAGGDGNGEEGGSTKMMTVEEIERRKEVKRKRKAELERQERLCAEMQREEIICRDFYRWEMKENLRERRLMKEEERVGLIIRKEEIRLRKEQEALIALKTGNAGGGVGNLVKGRVAALSAEQLAKRDLQLSYERRRQELKELTLERRRRAEDQRLMIIEDEMGEILREIDRIERQKKAFTAEYGEDEDSDEDGEEEDAESGGDEGKGKSSKKGKSGKGSEKKSSVKTKKKKNMEGDYSMSVMEMNLMIAKEPFPLPEWLSLPIAFNDWTMMQQNQFIKMHVVLRIKHQKAEKNIKKEEKRMKRLEDKSYKDWEKRFRVVEQQEMEAELQLMEVEEDVKDFEVKLLNLKENINKVNIFCREKGEEELKIRTELKKVTKVANQREDEYKEALDWYELCLRRAKNRDKLKRRVSNDCKWIDTDSINGFHQRFATELLRQRIYQTYFKEIVTSVVNRAEIIATERRLLRIQQELSLNKSRLRNRNNAMTHVLREIRCEEFSRMTRSALNERFFPKNRKNLLIFAYKAWLRFYLWNKGNKEAYKLKFEILKRQLDIDRQFKKQLTIQSAKDPATDDNTKDTRNNPLYPTLMQRVRERPVQCKECFVFYISSQNHSLCCAYHPQIYQMCCPPSCVQPGLTAACGAHRMRRWKCCGLTDARALGCSRKYHTPPDSDPVYDMVMEKINRRDESFLTELDTQVEIARKEDWGRKAKEVKRVQVNEMEEELEDARNTAARYHKLKFV